MNTLRQALEAYLALRQAMGFQVRDACLLLRRFIDFLEQREAAYITCELALDWATEPSAAQPAEGARRLSVIRGFARYRSATDPRTQIPLCGVVALPAAASLAIPLQRCRDQPVAASRRTPQLAHRIACPDLCGRVRLVGGHWHARRRTGRTG